MSFIRASKYALTDGAAVARLMFRVDGSICPKGPSKREMLRRNVDDFNRYMPAYIDPIGLTRKKVYATCGVYFLYSRGEIVYVGQSINVQSRIGQHFVDKDFDEFAYIECAREHLNILESIYILRLKPRYNKSAGCVSPDRLRELGISCYHENDGLAYAA